MASSANDQKGAIAVSTCDGPAATALQEQPAATAVAGGAPAESAGKGAAKGSDGGDDAAKVAAKGSSVQDMMTEGMICSLCKQAITKIEDAIVSNTGCGRRGRTFATRTAMLCTLVSIV